MSAPALLIGTAQTCERLERQLDLLAERPVSMGWLVPGAEIDAAAAPPGRHVLGSIDELEAVVATRRPHVALVCLPGVMRDLIVSIRTRLRKLGVPDRYLPPLEDQLAGVGPRALIDVDLDGLLGRPPRTVDGDAVRAAITGRRVLITGAGGTIGGELARLSAAHGPSRLTLVDRAENALFEIDRQVARRFPDLPRHALLHDVVDAAGTLRHLRRERPEVIFHAAAHKHVPMMEDHPAAAIDNNLFGTRSVADAAAATGVDRMILISTDKAVNPSSVMGATKRLAELYVQWMDGRSDTSFAAVRFGNVLGSAGSVVETWFRQIADGGPLTITDPRMTRYFMSIAEAASLVVQAAGLREGRSAGAVYLLDMGAPVSILELARRFIRAHGLEPLLPGEAPAADRAATMRVVFTGRRPGEKLHEELAYEAEHLEPTVHPDICIWKLSTPDDGSVDKMLSALGPAGRPTDAHRLGGLIRRMVPEMTAPACSAV